MSRSPFELLLNNHRHPWPGLKVASATTVALVVGLGIPEYGSLHYGNPYQGPSTDTLVTLVTLAIILLFLLPSIAVLNLSRALASLQRANFLRDLQLTRLRPTQLSDYLARQAVASVALPAMGFGLLLGVAPCLTAPSTHGLVFALLWVGMVLLATAAVAWLAQLRAVGSWLWVPPCVAVGLLAGGGLMAGCADVFMAVGAGLAAAGSSARYLTAWLLEHDGGSPLRLGSAWLKGLRAPCPNPYLQTDSPNPMVYRTMAAAASRVPGGLLGSLLWRVDGVLLALPLVWWAPRDLQVPLIIDIIGSWYLLRVIWNCWRQVSRDRAHLDLLVTTTMTAEEYVDGLAASATMPRLCATLLVLLVCSVAGQPGPSDMAISNSVLGIVTMLIMVLGTPILAYGSLYLAARCRSVVTVIIRFYAMGFLAEVVLGLPALLILGALGLAGLPLVAVWLIAMYVLAVRTLRAWAIARVGQRFTTN